MMINLDILYPAFLFAKLKSSGFDLENYKNYFFKWRNKPFDKRDLVAQFLDLQGLSKQEKYDRWPSFLLQQHNLQFCFLFLSL